MNKSLRLAGALLLGLLSTAESAQAQAWLWANQVRGVQMGALTNVVTSATAVTAAGDSYAAYLHQSAIVLNGQTYPGNPVGGQTYCATLAHHDAAGAVTDVLLSGVNAKVTELRVDAQGNVYAVGRFGGMIQAGATQLTSAAQRIDIFVGKWNAAGVLQWLNQGTEGSPAVSPSFRQTGLGVDAAGRVTVASFFMGSMTMGGQTVTGRPSHNNTFAAQFDAAGQLSWIRGSVSVGAQPGNVSYNDLAVAGDGDIYLLSTADGNGNTVSWGSATVPGTGIGVWLKLAPNGQIVASERTSGAFQVPGSHLAAGANGMSYVLTTSLGFSTNLAWGNTVFQIPASQQGFLVLQLDPNGVAQWARLGLAHDSAGVAINSFEAVSDLYGELPTRVYVGGNFGGLPRVNDSLHVGSLSLPAPQTFSTDGFVLRLNGDTGTPDWLLPVASSAGNDAVNAMSVNQAGTVLVGGSYGGTAAQFGAIRLNQPNNSTTAYLAKLVEAYNLTQGTAFTDLNANAVQDAGDFGRGGVVVEQQPGGQFLTTNANGGYSAVAELGTYSYSVPNPPLYYNVVAPANPVTFSNYSNIATGQDFALQPVANQQDIRVFVTPVSRARPGFTVTYRVTFENVGTVAIPVGSLSLTTDALLTYLSNTLGLVAQTGTTLAWQYNNLQPGESRDFDVLFQLVTTAPLGHGLLSTASIGPLSGDLTPADNTEVSNLTVTGSYDPNDIQVNYPVLTLPQVQNATRSLDYTVRFQNVGTDTAFTITVRDTLPGDLLNLGTLQLLSASHSCTWRLTADGMLTLRFLNIRLPYASLNSIASQGFARFRVVPRVTLALGDVIPNRAAIYFDFNAPVRTNTALTTVGIVSGQAEAGSALAPELAAWPNPTHEVLYVRVPAGSPSLTLLDATGRAVRTQAATAAETALDVRGLPAGLYVLRAGAATRRVVVR